MFSKTASLLALFSIATQVLATPPACLIAAVNTQPNPSALSAVCSGSNATDVQSYICKNCGDNVEVAMSGFAGVCGGAGVTIKNSTSCNSLSSSTGSSTKTATGGLVTGTSGSMIMTGASSGFATATGTPMGNGTISTAGPAPTATQSSSGGSSGSGSSGSSSASGAKASGTGAPANNAAARLGMDIVGLAALGAFGAMLAM